MKNQKTFTISEQIQKCAEMTNYKAEMLETIGVDWNQLVNSKAKSDAVKKLENYDIKIANSVKGYTSGLRGQKLAYQSIEICSDIIAMENIQTPSNDPNYSQEHDLIVIGKGGVFTIEVKNISTPFVEITEQGELKSTSFNGIVRNKGNVALQSRRHKASVYNLLKNTKFENIPVVSVMLFSNNNCMVENNFKLENGNKRIKDCYCNTFEDVLYDYPEVLSDDDMKVIAEIFKCANSKYPERRYPLVIDENEYISAVNAVVEENKSLSKGLNFALSILRGIVTGLNFLSTIINPN